jgi:hypothetical protein
MPITIIPTWVWIFFQPAVNNDWFFRIEMKLLIRALYRELRLNTLPISSLNTSWVENCHSIVKRRDYLAHASLGLKMESNCTSIHSSRWVLSLQSAYFKRTVHFFVKEIKIEIYILMYMAHFYSKKATAGRVCLIRWFFLLHRFTSSMWVKTKLRPKWRSIQLLSETLVITNVKLIINTPSTNADFAPTTR